MKISLLEEILSSSTYHTFLVDASGVIYTQKDICKGAVDAIRLLQSYGRVYLVTNNSYLYPHYINEKLKGFGISIDEDHIISSGYGLSKDPDLVGFLRKKRVYFVGRTVSAQYALDAGAILTDTISDADTVVLAGMSQTESEDRVQIILDELHNRPDIPIICCNPDRVVATDDGLYPVIGTYAAQIEKAIKRPILWYGKPLGNFSKLVQHILISHGVSVDQDVLFFDDNLENVTALQTHCGVSGCWVKGSGIQQNESLEEWIQQFGSPKYVIDGLYYTQ